MISNLGISGVGRGLWIKRNWIWRHVTFIVFLYGGSAYIIQSVVKRERKEEGSKRGKTENKKKSGGRRAGLRETKPRLSYIKHNARMCPSQIHLLLSQLASPHSLVQPGPQKERQWASLFPTSASSDTQFLSWPHPTSQPSSRTGPPSTY